MIKVGESAYHLASGGSGNEEKTAEAELVKRMVSKQLREVLGDNDEGPYITPVYSSTAPTSHKRIDKIGYNTLTRVVREELQRFRANAEAAGYSLHQRQQSSVRGKEGDYEEIDDVIKERDHSDADDIPQHPPPPLPLRYNASSTASTTTDTNRRPPPGSAGALVHVASESVRRRRVEGDDLSVIRLLERIEQSSAEIDASFTALVKVGFRSLGDWQQLAHELPICNPARLPRRIEMIEAKYRGDMKQQAAAALAEWRSYRGSKATLCELITALKRCNLLEEARFLSTMSQESAT